MEAQKWEKAPLSHVEAFAASLPNHALVERRKMFGYACAFVRGNMFCGLHETTICARLGETEAQKRILAGKAAVFAPMAGRVMKEYVAIPMADCSNPQKLAPWLQDALDYALTVPEKKPKSKKAKA